MKPRPPDPFPLGRDGQVRYRVEPASLEHLPGMLMLFEEAFPDSPFTALGHGFLEEILVSYITFPGACAYVCLSDDAGEVTGMVVGSEDSSRHRHFLFSRHRARMLLKAVLGIVGSSRALSKGLHFVASFLPLWRGADWVVAAADQGTTPAASLTFLAVSERYRRQGIANRLTEEFLQDMKRRGIGRLKLAVAADNHPAIDFYRSRGWQISARVSAFNSVEAYRLTYDSASTHPRRKHQA
jgi:ribosomal protein S18 acetylase RimI-like enzyme